MIKQSIDLFRKEQTMTKPDFEIYNYSDATLPKVFPHQHDFFELYYLLSDSMTYVMGNHEYHLEKGDLFLTPPGLLHYPADLTIRRGHEYSRIVLWINPAFFEKFEAIEPELGQMWNCSNRNYTSHIRPTAGVSHRIYDCLKRLIEEQQRPKAASGGMSKALLMELFVTISRVIISGTPMQKQKLTSNLFSNIINYIHAHLADELTLDLLSGEFFVSKGYISRLFKEYMGISVHQYILMLRLEGSRKAIESGVPITTASYQFGFRDYSVFYRAFKQAFLMSPKEYVSRMETEDA